MSSEKKVIWDSGTALEKEFEMQKRSDLRRVPNLHKTGLVQT